MTDNNGYYSRGTLMKRYDCARSTFYRMTVDPIHPFPAPVFLTPNAPARWLITDVHQWEQAAEKATNAA